MTRVQEADVTTRSLQVLKALAGNDRVKTEAGRDGMLPLVVTAMDRHVTRAPLVEAGCAAITSLTLRQVGGSNKYLHFSIVDLSISSLRTACVWCGTATARPS